MHLSYTPFALFLLALTSFVSSFSPLRVRQANLDLPNGLCAFNLDPTDDSIIDGQCDIGGGPINSFVPLDKCIINICGDLHILTDGGFSTSCSKCTLDTTLDFTCTCVDCTGQGVVSTINLNAVGPNDNGIFLEDNGHIACRSPNST